MPYRPDTYMMPDGQAAAPGLPFDAEPSSGFFRKAAGVLGLSIGGSEVGAFDANGFQAGLKLASVLFTQTSGNGTYTGTIALPAGSRIVDLGVDGQALWTGTSASMIVGDAADDDGFFVATDLAATDLLAGEINNLEHPGGKAGVYIASEQRVLFSSAARSVIGKVTQVGTGTAGRTRLYVVYAVAVTANATKA